MSLFIELVQVALGKRNELSRMPTAVEWEKIFDEAQRQAISGLMIDGLERLPDSYRPPQNLLFECIGTAQIIEQNNRLHRSVLIKTKKCLQEGGVDVAFMKGLICGARYNNPQRRQCGDIDFVVAPDCFEKTLNLLEGIGEVDRTLVHEHHGMAFVDGVQLEPHYKVHNYQNPKVDKAMRVMFAEVFPSRLDNVVLDSEEIPVFPPAFECALLVGHMVNHVYAEGLGLRQVIDFWMFLKKEHEAVKSEECKRYLRMMQMERTFRIFSCLCEVYLGLPHELLGLDYTTKEEQFATKLMDDILVVGNFGRGVDYLGRNKAMMPLKSYLWVFKRCIKLGYLCPVEARWWPVSKFTRYFSGKLLKKR